MGWCTEKDRGGERQRVQRQHPPCPRPLHGQGWGWMAASSPLLGGSPSRVAWLSPQHRRVWSKPPARLGRRRCQGISPACTARTRRQSANQTGRHQAQHQGMTCSPFSHFTAFLDFSHCRAAPPPPPAGPGHSIPGCSEGTQSQPMPFCSPSLCWPSPQTHTSPPG